MLIERIWRPSTLILIGAGLLASDPLRWLGTTWTDAAYNSQGAWIALTVVALAVWSWTSALVPEAPGSQRYAYGLLVTSAGVRAIGQLLRVNVVGATTLALDVYALSILAGLDRRERALSPGWLAALFAMSLPLERAVQRLLGYGLQQLSASAACDVLGIVDRGVHCVGTRILLDGKDLLVDLPCSGSASLMLILTLFAALATLKRPSARQAAIGFAIAVTAALASNTLRICALALGLAHDVDVMSAPWHELIGIAPLALAGLPLLAWARFVIPALAGIQLLTRAEEKLGPRLRGDDVWRAAAFAAAAAVVVALPAHPIDVAHATAAPRLPSHLAEFDASPQPLEAIERDYFAKYGGGASRARYGDFALLMVSTTAPLRHLHAPDECLRGAGHDVRYFGLEQGGLPTAIYRSTDPDGRQWRVAVSYVSSRGETAASVAQAVWLWLKCPDGTWTMVERVAPWSRNDADAIRFDAAVFRALDLPSSAPQSIHLMPSA